MLSPTAILSHFSTALRVILVLAISVIAVLAYYSWHSARDAAAELRSTLETQKKTLEQLAARERDRDQTLATTLAAIDKAKRAVQTPAQAFAQLPQVLPSLPLAVQITVPPDKPEQLNQPGEPGLPNGSANGSGSDLDASAPPPAVITVPQPDATPLYDYLQDCRACQSQLSAAQGDLADERSKNAALTTARDAAIRASQGGGFWTRTARDAKWLLIGSALGAVAALAATHR